MVLEVVAVISPLLLQLHLFVLMTPLPLLMQLFCLISIPLLLLSLVFYDQLLPPYKQDRDVFATLAFLPAEHGKDWHAFG